MRATLPCGSWIASLTLAMTMLNVRAELSTAIVRLLRAMNN
jgi:hypothetical protein